MHADVTIIGAGLAGLTCARELCRDGARVVLLEASDAPGGRVRTDRVNGPGGVYLVDRGFQVYLTAYPTAPKVLDHAGLNLRPFEPGAVIMHDGKAHALMDPWRRPGNLLDGALSKVGTLGDKLKVGVMRSEMQRMAPEKIYDSPERTILQDLTARGFSEGFIDRFFRPFFGGITFDDALGASSRMMQFVFRCFSLGDAAVPALGMGQISAQIAASLPAGVLHCESPVSGIDGTTVYTPSGRFTSERVVLACGPRVEAQLLGRAPAKTDARPWLGVTNLAFALPSAKLPSVAKGVLVLDGDAWRNGARVDATPRVINLAFMSSVSDAYAPAGYHLASLTMLGVQRLSDEALAEAALAQMRAWFGAGATDGWTLLKVSRIAEALPDQSPPWLTGPTWPQQVSDTMYRCGDHTDTASIDGAIVSGLRVAGMVRGMEK